MNKDPKDPKNWIFEDYKTKGARCPACNHYLDAAMAFGCAENPEPPAEGDVTVCAYCWNWLVFTDDHNMRELTENEIAELPDDMFNLLVKASQTLKAQKDEKARTPGI